MCEHVYITLNTYFYTMTTWRLWKLSYTRVTGSFFFQPIAYGLIHLQQMNQNRTFQHCKIRIHLFFRVTKQLSPRKVLDATDPQSAFSIAPLHTSDNRRCIYPIALIYFITHSFESFMLFFHSSYIRIYNLSNEPRVSDRSVWNMSADV